MSFENLGHYAKSSYLKGIQFLWYSDFTFLMTINPVNLLNILCWVSVRLVNLTESISLKIGLNMTETNKHYLFEHDGKVTTTNVDLLNATQNDWIWPKIENVINITSTTKMNDWIWPKIIHLFSVIFNRSCSSLWQFLLNFSVMFNKLTFVVVIFWSCSKISVILIWSC